jgi:methylated-DNA-[protein]-cysteine S-methyltransferase
VSSVKPTLIQYDAPGFGVGEVWLDEEGRVFYAELPRPRGVRPVSDRGRTRVKPLVRRLQRFFAGEAVSLDDVPLVLDGGFYGDCARALRRVPRGEVVTYGELAALAGRPGAARAAGTFCARCDLSPFVPTHRVISSTGLGPYGDLGAEYKRRLLELEGVQL